MEECPIDHRGESVKERSQRTSFSQCLLPMITDKCAVGHVTIHILPNDVLLEVFFLYQELNPTDRSWWQTLVHVCRIWRYTIFASPLRLHLVLKCTPMTPVRKSLNIWPPLPILIQHDTRCSDGDESITAALAHRDRVSEISLTCPFLKERFATLMQRPFPELKYVCLVPSERMDLSEAFLGGSAPSLRAVVLHRIAFPALPKFLLSTGHLVGLELWSIPNTGYISPEAMTTCLAGLPLLEHLRIEYESSASRPNQTNPPPFTRTVLPTLISFHFGGASMYLDDLTARIDAPALQTLLIKLSGPTYRVSQLSGFISRAERPKLPTRVMVKFYELFAYFKFFPSDSFSLTIRRGGGLSLIALVCQELSPFLSHVERLELHDRYFPQFHPNDMNMDTLQWLELFQPFISVQSLCVSTRLVPLIAPALQELTGARAIEVLPELHILFLEEGQPSRSVEKAIEAFTATRLLLNHPVVIRQW